MAAEPKPTLVTTERATGDSSSDSGDDDLMPRLHAKTFLAVFSVCLIYMSQVVCLVGAGAQGQVIAGHFGGTAQTVWFSAPITIMTVVLGPIVAQAADYWGRKWFLVSLTLVGAVGTVVVARASSINMAIGGFCVIGVAFGAQPLLHVVASEVLPRRWRAWGQAADMISNAVGSTLGLYVGGALNRTGDPASDGFRYYFYMAMACFVSAATMCALVYSPPPLPTQTQFTNAEKLAKLDWVGYFFLATGLVLFSVGLSYSKNPYEWTDPVVSATFAVGLAFVVGLVVYATRFKTDGMFHHRLFTGNRNFTIAAFCVFAEGVAFFAANTYFAFQVSVLYEHDALLVGVRYSTMMITSAIAACLTAWYCARARRVRWVTLSTPPELISIASGILISVRSLGGTVGLAIYNALFNEAMGHLGSNVADAVVADGLAPENVGPFLGALGSQNATALSAIPGVTPEMVGRGAAALQDTYVTAFRHVWIAGGCFVALAAVVAVFLFDPRKEFNMHIDAPVEKDEDMYSV
ncbi:major facilitator superfamily domain-containing protein [Lasiosphaeria ovina]|uniref:Major facilitator superfamily domain-containing protein n=1 Tax=Lasiosphaeria ovina TaxID=92902 RepID=A0AAE0N1H0_9PEZI|nr:major facilitator superfamily domain-containing protein [Lasiosphaeria ovina]